MNLRHAIPVAALLGATGLAAAWQAAPAKPADTNAATPRDSSPGPRVGPAYPNTSARATPAGTTPVHPPQGRPTARVTNPSIDERLVLVPVASNTRDTSSVSTSLRSEAIDLRAPRLFEQLFALRKREDTDLRGGTLLNFGSGNVAASSHALESGGTKWFARLDGGVIALFPRSTYVETDQGRFAEIPAGTIYALGRPPASLLGLEPVKRPEFTTPDATTTDTSRPMARPADQGAGRSTPAMLQPTSAPKPADDAKAADASAPSVFQNDVYRSRRIRALLLKAARTERDREHAARASSN